MAATPHREDVVAMLATLGDRSPDQVGERIDSMELAWLLHQVEQRYGVSLALPDEVLARMSTVDGVLTVLGELLAAPGQPPLAGTAHSAGTGHAAGGPDRAGG